MSTKQHTEESTTEAKTYIYARINFIRPDGTQSTISIHPDEYSSLATLARGSTWSTVERRISEACRQAARELLAKGYTGKLSPAVRKRALAKLRGSYREAQAQAFDRAQFPEGEAVAA